MNIEDISQLMQNAVHRGVAKAIAENGSVRPLISKAEAYHLFGRSNVDRWLMEKLLSLFSAPGNGSKKLLDRTKLDSIAAASNRHTYLPVADR